MKKKLLLGLSISMLLLLCACGIEMNTDFSVEKDFKGTRTILCSMSKSDVRALNKDFSSLDTIIKRNCPNVMTYKNQSDDKQFSYTFTIAFSSFEDYKEKVSKCLNFAPTIDYYDGNSPFANGLLYKENFTSKDLMSWFSESLVKEEFLTKSEVSDIWSIKDTNFSFHGKSYQTSDTISIDELSYLSLDHIDIYTDETSSNGYKRSVAFHIPKKTLDDASMDVKDYLTSGLDTSKYNITWDVESSGRVCNITFSANTINDLVRMTNKVLKSNGTGKCDVVLDETAPFHFQRCYQETYDLSSFRSSKDGNVNYYMYFKPSKDSSMEDFKELSDNGYYLIRHENKQTLKTAWNVTHIQSFDAFQLTTIYHSTEKFERELLLSYTDDMSKNEYSVLVKHLKDLGFSCQKTDNSHLLLKISGSPSRISRSYLRAFLGKSDLTVSSEKKFFEKSHSTDIKDSIDLSAISWTSSMKGTYYFISNSDESSKKASMTINDKAITLNKSNTLEKSSVSDSSSLAHFKGSFKASCKGGTQLQFVYTGGVTDVYGSIAVGLSFVVIAVGILILIVYRFRKPLLALITDTEDSDSKQ